MHPIVLVLSNGLTKPLDIINKIIEMNVDAATTANENENKTEILLIGNKSYKTYLYVIKNKYFEVTIVFLPFEGGIESVPLEILNKTEALIVYFDSQKKCFLQKIPQLCKIVQNNNIGLGLFVTHKLNDESDVGLNYNDIKSQCLDSFDIIELCVEKDVDINRADEDLNENYNDINEALNNYVWSNVVYNNKNEFKPINSNKVTKADETSGADVESQLEAFENLLTSIQRFKTVSATLDRNEVLNQAESLAELFDELVNEI